MGVSKSRITINPGDEFGKLVVLRFSHMHKHPAGATVAYYLCRCECGRKKSVRKYSLTSGATVSCGCQLGKTSKHYSIAGKSYTVQELSDIAGINYSTLYCRARKFFLGNNQLCSFAEALVMAMAFYGFKFTKNGWRKEG